MGKSTNDFIKLCPTMDNVFSNAQNTEGGQLQKFFFPLCSINLQHLNPQWSDVLHVIYYNAELFNDSYAVKCPNFKDTEERLSTTLRFDVVEDKYLLKTPLDTANIDSFWWHVYQKAVKTYAATRQMVQQIPSTLSKLGNQISFDSKDNYIAPASTPLDSEGQPMTFICRLYSGSFCQDNCEKDLHLFYSPTLHQAAQVSYML